MKKKLNTVAKIAAGTAGFLYGGPIGAVVGVAACTAVQKLCCKILNQAQLKKWFKDGTFDDAIKCAAKNANHVTFEDLDKTYEVEAEVVSDDIEVGMIYNFA
ncbi:MAG: hypothetical protein LUG91_03690 [Ruminococcus sp.]|nr:hypothetical protein [Ruminococcus sp.]